MKKVLLVDNDVLFSKDLCGVLSTLGYDVSMVETGFDAVTLFNREQFDLVITNLSVPLFCGNDVARHARLVRKKEVFIIGLSEKPAFFKQDEFDRIVSKPILTSDLVHTISGLHR
jgi:DNA-binding response OmpR family regulator